jgi:hypothetical protein
VHFAGQPDDNGQSENGIGQHCVDFWADHENKWDDYGCEEQQFFVCECNPDNGGEGAGYCKYDNFGKK